MAERQGAVDVIKYSVYTCDDRYVNIIKVALYKVTSDPFIKVSSDCVSV